MENVLPLGVQPIKSESQGGIQRGFPIYTNARCPFSFWTNLMMSNPGLTSLGILCCAVATLRGDANGRFQLFAFTPAAPAGSRERVSQKRRVLTPGSPGLAGEPEPCVQV